MPSLLRNLNDALPLGEQERDEGMPEVVRPKTLEAAEVAAGAKIRRRQFRLPSSVQGRPSRLGKMSDFARDRRLRLANPI
jgi:hypothetical protein